MNVILWYLLVVGLSLIGLIYSENDPHHLCSKVTSGRFDLIHLKSFTYYERNQLVIFESDQKYYIDLKSITNSEWIPVPVRYDQWNSNEMSVAVSEMELTTAPQAVYMIAAAHNRIGLSVVTRDKEYMWNVVDSKRPQKMWKHEKRIYPKYALLMELSSSNGHIIHQDIYDKKADFIIYDMKFDSNIALKMPNDQEKEVEYYYMEKTDKSNEILFRHRFTRQEAFRNDADNQARQLFTSHLPVGYKNGSTVYLFDSKLGCVNVIMQLSNVRTSANEQRDFVRKRVNIPFELFFKCSQDYVIVANLAERFPANRCETTFTKSANEPVKWPTKAPFMTPLMWVMVAILVLAVVALLLLLVFLIAPQNKQKKAIKKVNDKKNKKKTNVSSPFSSNVSTTTSPTKTVAMPKVVSPESKTLPSQEAPRKGQQMTSFEQRVEQLQKHLVTKPPKQKATTSPDAASTTKSASNSRTRQPDKVASPAPATMSTKLK